jgi:hypothetical protein
MCLNHIDGHLAEKKRTGLLVAHIVVKINYIMALCSVTSFLHCLIRNRVKTKWRKARNKYTRASKSNIASGQWISCTIREAR